MKRLLLFLLLVALGVAALRLAIGGESAVPDRGMRSPGAAPDATEAPPTPPGVALSQGGAGASVTQTGAIELPRWREVPEPGGRVRRQEVFVLKAADSRPVGDGLQQLDRVEVRLFDSGRHAATLTARQAFVELERDASGRPSLNEGKDIDLRDTVLTGVPGGRLGGMRLELGDARVRVGDVEVVLTTEPDQPVLAVVDDARKVTLRGRGAQARLPRDRNGGLQRADVEILRDPVLETDGAVVRAAGRLLYVEDMASGTAQVVLDDAVVLELARGDLLLPLAREPGGPAPGPTVVRGDQFTGWLLRDRAAATERVRRPLSWRQLVLTGAPASVDVDGGRLTTPRLTVLPGPAGEPFLLTAHGGESRLEQTAMRPGSRQRDLVVATAQRRIHLVRPGEHSGALHRAMGFPRWTLRPFDELQVVLGDGATRFAGGRRTIDASRGARAFRRDRTETGIVHGLGVVRVEQRARSSRHHDLVGSGSDGFRLRVTPERELLQLGPPRPEGSGDDSGAPWRQHRFVVQHGDATVQGRGVCDVEQSDAGTFVDLHAADADVAATMPSEGLRLRRLQRLRGRLVGEDLFDLDAAGWPLEITFERDRQTVVAQAPRVVQAGPRSLRLLPVPAEAAEAAAGPWPQLAEPVRLPLVRRTVRYPDRAEPEVVEIRGPRLDLHHAGGRDLLVEATAEGDQLPYVYARVPQAAGGEPTTIACAAERLRLLPFVASSAVRRWHTGAPAGALGVATFHALGQPWLLVDGVRDFQLDDVRHGHVEGRSHRLLVSQGARAALFVGDPDTGTPAEVLRRHDGREVTMRGARVRVFDDEAVRLQALGTFADRSTGLQPSLLLHEPGRTGVLAHLLATCRGNIDVRPESIEFLGPVAVQGLTADGSDDPDGIRLDARTLRMTRAPATGEITTVIASDVTVEWTRFDARCAAIEFDLRRDLCVVSDPVAAQLTLREGWTYFAPRFELNYETLAFRSHRGRAVQRSTQDGEQR